jgi:hypothetical protein
VAEASDLSASSLSMPSNDLGEISEHGEQRAQLEERLKVTSNIGNDLIFHVAIDSAQKRHLTHTSDEVLPGGLAF